MGRPMQKGLRPLTQPEEQELQRIVKATSERVDPCDEPKPCSQWQQESRARKPRRRPT